MRYTVGLPRFTDVDTNKRKCDKKEHKRIKKVADRNKSLVMKQSFTEIAKFALDFVSVKG